MIKNQIIEVGERRWKIKEAVSMEAAMNAIAQARVGGSVSACTILDSTNIGGDRSTIASVAQINSDGTERTAYSPLY